jgi:protein-L-isoaspartate(D-aspartate) O-methyltransferase
MIEPTPWNQHATQLFAKLEKDGLVKTPELADVFWDIPRHEYIDALYVHANDIPSWRQCPRPKRPEADEDWLARIYADDFLAVKIGEDGIPLCFNMRPSTVFWLLGLLQVPRGSRVLDIGTGTGQFAALLTRLVGEDGQVMSLEIDPELASTARNRIAALLPQAPVTVREADAAQWHEADREFDALVSTASCWTVPPGWLAALRPGGRAVIELRGDLGGAVLLAKRSADSARTLATGEFADRPIGLMPLRKPQIDWDGILNLPDVMGGDELGRAPTKGLGYGQFMMSSFGWYCQLEFPDAKLLGLQAPTDGLPAKMFLLADYGMDAVELPFDGTSPDSELVTYGGTSMLLERLTAAWQQWHDYEQPGLDAYSFSADHGEVQRIRLGETGKSWELTRENQFQ